jgi:hypothetical protein
MINKEEIDSIEEVGNLDGEVVKMIRLKGGFHICTGKPRGKKQEEVLAAGSHPAIVKYKIEKQYPDFRPSMMKNEACADNSIVDRHSHFLSDELRKSGHDLYSVQVDTNVNFYVTKNGITVSSASGQIVGDSLEIQKMNFSKDLSGAIAGAASEKALGCGASKVCVKKA